MSKKILIDGLHREETRVAIIENNRIQAYDYESPDHKPLRGNIYLAKVMRVEPSLQAAFVDFGGNRHGFLAFNEIHPDYFQIPVADRQALLKEAEDEARRIAELEEAEDEVSDEGDSDGQDHQMGGADYDENGDDRNESDDSASEEEGAVQSSGAGDVPNDSAPKAPKEQVSAPSEMSGDNNDSESEIRPKESRFRRLWRRPGFTRALKAKSSDDDVRESAPVSDMEAGDKIQPDAEPQSDGQASHPSLNDAESSETADAPQTGAHGHETGASESDSGGRNNHMRGRRRNGRRSGPRSSGGRGGRYDGLGGSLKLADRYSIQEIIKRGQIMLIQVVKEERGNKGAALTTYLSFAGRYSVLMPNTARGSGVSRKISKPQDRRRLKEIAAELNVPASMGVILRTAGASRTKADIQRDFTYLAQLWDQVRALTMGSVAPSLVYEEGSLIKRIMRDVFDKTFSEVIIQGQSAYKEATDMMALLDPTQVDRLELYKGRAPLFTSQNIEKQIDAMYSPTAQLPSGGYIVINQTEALVAIDVNSGKATREHNIEAMALSTNLEAAEEICRQLKLRDLAGLIVIDFIDMDERRNNRAIESKLKTCLRLDRARTQVGSISSFGLLEMSRQRQRTGLTESSSEVCPTCNGSGQIRSPHSLALQVLRGAISMINYNRPHDIVIKTRSAIALTILNAFRDMLSEFEAKAGITIVIDVDNSLGTDRLFRVEKQAQATRRPSRSSTDKRADDPVTPMLDQGSLDTPEVDDQEGEVLADEAAKHKRSKRRVRHKGKKAPDHTQGPERLDEAGVSGRDDAAVAEAVAESEATATVKGSDDGDSLSETPPKRRRVTKSRAKASSKTDDATLETVPQVQADSSDGSDKVKAKRTTRKKPLPQANLETEALDAISHETDQDGANESDKAILAEPEVQSKPEVKRRCTKKIDRVSGTASDDGPSVMNDEGADVQPPSQPLKSVTVTRKAVKSDAALSDEAGGKPKRKTAVRKTAVKSSKSGGKSTEKILESADASSSAQQTDGEIAAKVIVNDEAAPSLPKRSGWWQKS